MQSFLSPLQRQEWLAARERKYIEDFSNKNIANQTPGEFIPTGDSYAEYLNNNLKAEEYILNRRRLKSVRYKNLLGRILARGQELRASIDKIEIDINHLRFKKSTLDRFLSIFGKIGEEEALLLARQNILMLDYRKNQENIFIINYKIRQLKSKKFNDQEIVQMENFGRQYKEEFSRYKRR